MNRRTTVVLSGVVTCGLATAAVVALQAGALDDVPVQVPVAAPAVVRAVDAPAPSGPDHAEEDPGSAAGDGKGAAPADRDPIARVDPQWAEATAEATGIPLRAFVAYASADLIVGELDPGCGIGWNTLAGIGSVESHHGTYGGSTLADDGRPDPPIRGIALDGSPGVAAIEDTDGGDWDGDDVWDRAVGPMQFIPTTWELWAADGDGDGEADPNQIDDAALAAARYLCSAGPMSSTDGWRGAVLAYNRSTAYVDDVAARANTYALATADAG